jgi:hypothetical protein
MKPLSKLHETKINDVELGYNDTKLYIVVYPYSFV